MTVTKAVESLEGVMSRYAWRDDPNSIRAKSCGACYEYYFTYAQQFRPAVVVEIGVQRGYSAIAFLLGYPEIKRLYLFDNDADGYPLAEAVRQIERAKTDLGSTAELVPVLLDTQSVGALPVPGPVNLAHVDGRHTREAASHDLGLVAPLIAPGGRIVMDDLWHPGVLEAAGLFAQEYADWQHTTIPAHTTHQLSTRPR